MPKPSNYSGGSSSSPRRRRAPQKSGSARRPATGARGVGRLLLAALVGASSVPAAAALYLYFGHPPVAVADKPALWEHLSASVALHRRMAAEAKQPPFPASEKAFEAAARIYRTQCAQCHGSPGQESSLGRAMLPHAQQFFGRDRKLTAATPAGQIFWATNFGVRRSGMPGYARMLSNTDEWNLALLLHNADQPLPEPVEVLLAPTMPSTAPTAR